MNLCALAGVAQLVWQHPVNQKVAGSVPSGYMPGLDPQWGGIQEAMFHINVLLPPSPFFSL